MLLHRAVATLIATLSICCSVALNGTANASTPSDTLYVAHTSAGTVQNNGAESVMVYRNGSSSGAASVLCHTVNGTALSGRDFTAVSTTLHWASGDATPKSCNVPISDATPFSGTRMFYIELSGPTGATLGSANKVTVTIYGNKGGGAVSVAAPTYTVAQNAGHATISVNRTGGSAGTAVVFYATANKTAIAGTDYTAEQGILSWRNGDSAPKTFSIPISNAKPFAGTKTLAVAIAHAETVVLGNLTSAIVTIDGGQGTTSEPTVTIAATPTAVAANTGPSLTWKATNATTCTASGGWSGLMPTSGTMSTGPISASTTYTLDCSGTGGSAAQSVTVSVASTTPVSGVACPVTSGPLTLKVSTVRTSGISPFLVFFDATSTTDTSISGNTTTFQDVTYTWNFGDAGASGSGTWTYGANAGHNSKNTATGGVAAHLYVTSGTDTPYTATVTATDGTNTASCQVPVTAFDPAGANGFAGTKTTCVSASGTPTPGSGDCPVGAAVLNTSSFNTALGSAYFGSGKRVLFKCGDTFSGDNVTLTATTASIGAYGGCEGTQTGQPIFNDTAGSGAYQLDISPNSGDLRIADIYFNGNGSGGGAVSMAAGPTQAIPYQVTLWNLQSTGNAAGYYWAQGAQWGLIGSTQLNSRDSIAVFLNTNENNPTQWNGAYPNLNYQAAIGNFVNGVGSAGGSGAGIEAFRVSACRLCVFENNTIENANDIGGVFKMHNGNTNGSVATWTGIYTELVEISDNLFTGNSGGILSDIAPQNGGLDERLRNFVIERNLYSASTTAWGGQLLLVSGANMTLRDNVFYMPGPSSTIYPILGAQIAQRGAGNLLTVQYNEAYNNTCYAPNSQPNQTCIGFDTIGSRSAPSINSVARNNLFYVPSRATGPTVDNTGTGNSVSNNTVTVTNNPGFTNGSGDFSLITDFKPTANYLGGLAVPVWYDTLGVPWAPTWDLGAMHH